MIYLVSEKKQRTIKIGYTDNPAKRISEYKTYNPSIQFISWKEGDKSEEKKWQFWLEFIGCEKADEEYNTEWYIMPNTIDKNKLRAEGFEYLVTIPPVTMGTR